MRFSLRGVDRRSIALVAPALVPWTWFLLRDHLGELGDILSLGAPLVAVPLLAAVGVAALWLPIRFVALWMASLGLVLFFVVFGPRLPARIGEPVDPFTLVTANVRFDNPTPGAAAADLLALDADVLVVPESTDPLIDVLRPHYEFYAQVDDKDGVYGTSVLSRYPLSDYRPLDVGNGVFRVDVAAPHPFVLVAAHLDRPSVSPGDSGYVTHGDHYREVVGLAAAVADADRPVVIAGDLNMSDRVRAYRYLDGRYEDLARRGWASTTYVAGIYRWFLLRIDHVFATDGWCSRDVDEFSITGSDHRGLRLDIGPCR